MHEAGLIVFLRNPLPGKVKSRISRETSDSRALAIYKELVSITLDVCAEIDAQVYLFYEGGIPSSPAIENFKYVLQSAGALGDKMQAAFDYVLHRHAKAIIIGSDCPALRGEDLTHAFQLLGDHDVVLGPAEDGGYYLLGMKDSHDFLFHDQEWGSDQVLETTLHRIRQHALSYALLKELYDIDTLADWKRFLRSSGRTDVTG